MSNKETLRILQEFADHQKKTVDGLCDTVADIKKIADDMTAITNSISLLLWKMEVLVHPVLLKDIYNLPHEEWMGLSTEEIVEMVEAIENAPQ